MSSSIDAGNLPEGGGREGFWRWMKPSRRQRSVLPPVGILRRALQDDDGTRSCDPTPAAATAVPYWRVTPLTRIAVNGAAPMLPVPLQII